MTESTKKLGKVAEMLDELEKRVELIEEEVYDNGEPEEKPDKVIKAVAPAEKAGSCWFEVDDDLEVRVKVADDVWQNFTVEGNKIIGNRTRHDKWNCESIEVVSREDVGV